MTKPINPENILIKLPVFCIVEIIAVETIKSFFKPQKKEWWQLW